MVKKRLVYIWLVAAGLLLAAAPAAAQGTNFTFLPLIESGPAAPNPVLQSKDPVINAVGDIAACGTQYPNRSGYLQTAALLNTLSGPVLGLGDYVYPDGEPTYFTNCFNPVWGVFKSRLSPAVGNHEYLYPNAAGYYGYFGSAAGSPLQGWYSFNIGTWHVVALNSNCQPVGSCKAGSPQEQWLRADLATHPARCTLAFWHHPLVSSGKEGNDPEMQPIWQALYDAHADIVLNGHDHSYERFAPINPLGKPDPVNGIVEIVAGTGGKDHSA
ncbi:MAG TPA: metallophosphoesterase, partial [Anaerolineaceae bacterium]